MFYTSGDSGGDSKKNRALKQSGGWEGGKSEVKGVRNTEAKWGRRESQLDQYPARNYLMRTKKGKHFYNCYSRNPQNCMSMTESTVMTTWFE